MAGITHDADAVPNNQPAAIRSSESFNRAIHDHWDSAADSTFDPNQPQFTQMQKLLQAHLAKAFGGDDEIYVVGGFTDRDIPGRKAMGYVVLSKGMFPKEMMNDKIASGLGLSINADGTIRWGSRGEIIICMLRSDIWLRNKAREAEAAKRAFNKAVPVDEIDKSSQAVNEPARPVAAVTKEQVTPMRKVGSPKVR